ncbi:hypothetical protein QQ045_033660 [Rhodiola kirilowii]
MMNKIRKSESSTTKSSAEAVFLEDKQKKKWKDEKTGYVSYTIFARALYVTWGGESNYWDWNCFKEMGEDGIEVVKLKSVCWLDVRGKFKISLLSPGIEYEIFYVVKVKRGGSGWELPITLALSIPKKMDQARKLSLLDQPRGEWIELSVGRFTADANDSEEINFDLYEYGGHWKDGLVIHSAIIRPRVP